MIGEFFSHADQNPHGWGFAELSSNQTQIIKSPDPANVSALAKELLLEPIVTITALVHIRYATVGDITLPNCHPFTAQDISGRNWTLIHKGTIFEFDALDPFFHTQTGSTDSERILLYLVDKVNAAIAIKGSPLEPDERFALFETVAVELSPNNCVNLLVYDSNLLFVHSNYQGGLMINTEPETTRAASTASTTRAPHAAHATSKDGSSGLQQNATHDEKTVLLCTSHLTSAPDPDSWQPLTLCTAFAYKHGELCYVGTTHDCEYRDSKEDTKYLYQDFASL